MSLELFSELGFNGVTTKVLAKRAGVTEKTLFHYFPTKKALYDKVLHHRLLVPLERSAFDGVGKDLPDAATLKDKLMAIVANLLHYLYETGPTLSLVAQELILNKEFRSAFLGNWTRRQRETCVAVIREHRHSGELRNFSEEAVFETLLSLTFGHGVSQLLFSTEPPPDADTEAALIVDILLNGVLRHP